MSVTAKSVIFDIDRPWHASSNYIGIRSIEFLLGSSVITMTSGFTAYATTIFDSNYAASCAFNTSLSKTGTDENTCWVNDGSDDQERLIIVFDSPVEFDEIVVNNYHVSGASTAFGAKNVVITYSTDAITNTAYGASISNSTTLFSGTFPEHVASDTADDQTVWPVPPVVIGIDFQEPLAELAIEHTRMGVFTPAKSVIFDIENNWAGSTYTNIRSIDFLNNGELISMTSGFTAYATSDSGPGFEPANAFNTSLSKTGSRNNTSWLSGGSAANQRLSIVFTTPIQFDEIVINNGHNYGSNTSLGAKNVVVTMSTDAITSTVYGSAITNSLELFDGTFTEHSASDEEDPETIYEGPARVEIDFQEPTAELSASAFRTNNIVVDINEHCPAYSVATADAPSIVFINFIESRPVVGLTFGEPLTFEEPLPEVAVAVSNPAVIDIDFNESAPVFHVGCASPLMIDVDYREPFPSLAIVYPDSQSISISFDEPTLAIAAHVGQDTTIDISFVEPTTRIDVYFDMDTRFRLLRFDRDRCQQPDTISVAFVEPISEIFMTT